MNFIQTELKLHFEKILFECHTLMPSDHAANDDTYCECLRADNQHEEHISLTPRNRFMIWKFIDNCPNCDHELESCECYTYGEISGNEVLAILMADYPNGIPARVRQELFSPKNH